MVMGSELWMEGDGLGLARNIVQRYRLEMGSEQRFGVGEKFAQPAGSTPCARWRRRSRALT
jgi:transposase